MAPVLPTAPLRLRPLYMDRVWGGRKLESVFGRKLESGHPVGESWEVVDREEAQSVVEGGAWDGESLHKLWSNHREAIFGAEAPNTIRFPLLVKILDARDTLSIQVHPPAEVAASLGGEPKTEMWYVVEAEPEAALYAGVQPGVDRALLAAALQEGTAEACVHRLPVRAGDAIFIPSGRLHAIGAGLVIFEIQQNSDTTYRVYDWNRVGLDGAPRELHVEESLRCIDFADTAPRLSEGGAELAACPFFKVSRHHMKYGGTMQWGAAGEFSILAVAQGEVRCAEGTLRRGDFVLMPACLEERGRGLVCEEDAVLLEARFGS